MKTKSEHLNANNELYYLLKQLRKKCQADSAALSLILEIDKLVNNEIKISRAENWIKTRFNFILSKIQGTKKISEFGDILAKELALCSNSEISAFYIFENKSFIPISSYGIGLQYDLKPINPNEGLFGLAVLNKKPKCIYNIPSDYLKVQSSLGFSKPKNIIILPIFYHDEVCGVVELASFSKYSKIQKKLLKQISETVGVSLKSIAANELTNTLFQEIAVKNSSLASQKEALDSSAIVAETDLKGKITYVNDKFIEISKYSKEELINQDHRILNSKYHPKEFFINLWKTISKGEIWHGEVRNKAKDGSLYWVDTTIYPVKDETGKLKKYVAIRFDITDKKRALEELQLATDNAEKLAKIKTDFLANMSHEIRTPLNAIIGIGDLLNDTKPTEEQTKYISIFQRASNNLLQLINDILDISKLEAGQIKLDNKPFQLQLSIKEIVELISITIKNKNIKLSVNFDPTIEETYLGDAFRFKQILINLIGNAVKFTEKGEIKIIVKNNDIENTPGNILIEIIDTGIGMSKEQIENIFQPFSQADTMITKKYGGTGLGLTICKKFIEMMGGKIWVRSEQNKGSEFYFTVSFPKASINSDTNLINFASGSTKLKRKSENDYLKLFTNEKLKILLTDDSEDNRTLIQSYLKSFPVEIELAENGLEAVEKFKTKNYDIILMDMQMPLLNGYEATKQIRLFEKTQKNTNTKIIALTAFAFPEEETKTTQAGCDLYLSKPIKKQTLLDCLFSLKVNYLNE